MRAIPAWVLALLLLPGAAAGESVLSLESGAPVAVAGRLVVTMPSSSLLLFDPDATGLREIHGVSGIVTFWTWKEAYARPLDAGGVELREQVGHAVAESFRVANATLRFVLARGPFEMVVALDDGGEAAIGGTLHAEGMPQRLGRAAEEPVPVLSGRSAMRPPGDVAWEYSPGWSYVGNHLLGHEGGFSPPEDGRARFEGGLSLKATWGRVEFRAADGHEVRRELGTVPGGEPGMLETRLLILDATAASADLPLAPLWGLAGPVVRWDIEGRATWRNATGRISREGGVERFEDARVEVEGTLAVVPEAPLLDTLHALPASYEGRGRFDARLDGVPARASAAVAGPVAVVSFAALAVMVLVAWKGVGVLFTRTAPRDVLLHPRRRAIHEAVRDCPGERLRDLQRRVDMAWGAFSFHLHVLVRSGHLVLRKEGAYTLALPIVPGERTALIPHPTARAVYDVLPQDGSPIPFVELRARLGFSRQRVNHHLHALQTRGLVEVRRGPDGARGVSRRETSCGRAGPS